MMKRIKVVLTTILDETGKEKIGDLISGTVDTDCFKFAEITLDKSASSGFSFGIGEWYHTKGRPKAIIMDIIGTITSKRELKKLLKEFYTI
jgi:hypothetical protein